MNNSNRKNFSSRFFTTNDTISNFLFFKIPNDWWSRLYEYPWAIEFAKPNDTCLDAGCGIGHPFKFALAQKCKSVSAIDIDPCITKKDDIIKSVTKLVENNDFKAVESVVNKINFKCCTLTNTPFKEKTFDKIYCLSVLEHMPSQDIQLALNEFSRILKDDGIIILTIDYPSVNLSTIRSQIKNANLKLVGDFDDNIPSNAIYHKGWRLHCFRFVLSKI